MRKIVVECICKTVKYCSEHCRQNDSKYHSSCPGKVDNSLKSKELFTIKFKSNLEYYGSNNNCYYCGNSYCSNCDIPINN